MFRLHSIGQTRARPSATDQTPRVNRAMALPCAKSIASRSEGLADPVPDGPPSCISAIVVPLDATVDRSAVAVPLLHRSCTVNDAHPKWG